jgi:malate synthase
MRQIKQAPAARQKPRRFGPPHRRKMFYTKLGAALDAAKRDVMSISTMIDPAAGVAVHGAQGPRFEEILTPAALAFLAGLHRSFDARRRDLLNKRMERQKLFDAGQAPDFLEETRSIREGDWRVAPIPADLIDRRVEITGPVDRKMIVNALNSGAKVFMADFEDATSPVYANMIEGQINLKDRWAGKIDFTDAGNGKSYKLGANPAVLMVRPRGWHLPERHVTVDDEEMSGSLFDFGLYVFHNAKAQIALGATPAFYLPKMESHLEARLWNDVFSFAEENLGIAAGTFKATVLIETLPAAFEMDEIIYELRDHMAGLNCGRWDYIFSYIKRLGKNARYLTPDRAAMTMGEAFLSSYSLLLIKTCHRRGAFAMGGMAAQIPVKGDPKANEAAFAKVRADKEREATNGHDGTWVAHPDLVPVAREVFDRLMPGPNQLGVKRDDVTVTREELVRVHGGVRTEAGLRENIRVGVQYIEAWLRGRGAVPLYNLMEDAATAEISRAQIWQWLKLSARLDDGRIVTPELFKSVYADEMDKVRAAVGAAYEAGRFGEAIQLFSDMSLSADFEEFLTLPAYRLLG